LEELQCYMFIVEFQNVYKVYNSRFTALEDVSFKIKPGEFVSIVGISGAGKTTIVKLLIGEEKPTKGRIFFNSYEVNKLKPYQLPAYRRNLGIIFQDFRLLPEKTVFENVAYALEVEGHPQRRINKLVPYLLKMVGLEDKARNFPRELSGGEKQRTAIARAMINQPQLVIADEPTGNLDPFNTWEVIKLLVKINQAGSTVILATHNKEIIDTLGQRVITLEKGRVIRDEQHGQFVLSK